MRKTVKRAVLGVGALMVLAVFGGSAILILQYARLPADQPFVPHARAEEIVELPRRPGIFGILIDIPREKPNLFSVDMLRSERLDWDALKAIDFKADVRVYGFIDDDGRLKVGDVIDVDHARAGNFISEIVRSWVFKPLKRGTIMFHFNLPSEGEKLIIYTAGLTRQESIDREIPILDGRLHNVTGLDPALVRVIKKNP
jgi:hypothetical protein